MPAYLTEKNLTQIFESCVPEFQFVHNKTVPDSGIKSRPDYRFETIKLIVEFDGYRHYQNTAVILSDYQKDKIYSAMGYRIFRLPYFIQMTSKIISQLFNQTIPYNQTYPHGFIDEQALLPADFCELGIQRFLSDLNTFEDYKSEIIDSLQRKITEKKEINLVLPPSLHYLVNHATSAAD